MKALFVLALALITFGSCKKETETQPKPSVDKMMPREPKRDMSNWD